MGLLIQKDWFRTVSLSSLLAHLIDSVGEDFVDYFNDIVSEMEDLVVGPKVSGEIMLGGRFK